MDKYGVLIDNFAQNSRNHDFRVSETLSLDISRYFSPTSAIIWEIGHIQLPKMAYVSKTITSIESPVIFRPLNIIFGSK